MEFLFGGCSLDLDRRELRSGPELIAMEPQAFDVLVNLVQDRDRVVSKDDLFAAVWHGRIVSESTLTTHECGAQGRGPTQPSRIGDVAEFSATIARVKQKPVRQ